MPSLPTSTMLYWRIGTYSGFALHQVTIWRSLADLSKQWRMTITWGKNILGNPHFETYLPSDIRDNYLPFQCPATAETAYRWVAFVPEARDFGCGYGHSKSTSFRLSAGGAGFGGFGGEICFKKWPIWNDDSDYFVIRIIFIFMYIFIYQYINISFFIYHHIFTAMIMTSISVKTNNPLPVDACVGRCCFLWFVPLDP